MYNDFYKFATSNGVSPSVLRDYVNHENKTIIPNAGYINPTIIEERPMNVATMDVFSRLMMDRTIFLGTDVNEYSANVIQAQLLYLDSCGDKDISMYINSPGGEVYSGLAIYDTMEYIKSDVATLCTGMAASMASVLLCAGQKDKRFALPHSRVMIHQPLGGTRGQASDMEIAVEEIKKVKTELYNIISEHSNMSYDEVWKASDRDHWMTSSEALNAGMIDKILKKSC